MTKNKADRILELASQINQAQTAYYNGSSTIDDDEYDALVYELSKLNPTNPLLIKVGADPVAEWKKEKHLIPLGSLNKLNYPNEMSDWIANTLSNKETLVVEKLDGLSIGCQYQDGKLVKAVLRGNGLEGENIVANVLKMNGCVSYIPNFNGTIRGEIVLTKSDHQKYFPSYSNPRNAASGLCRRLDGDGCEHLTLMFYQAVGDDDFDTELAMLQFLTKQEFITPQYKKCSTSAEVNQLWKEYQDTTRLSLNYEIDGLVVSCNDTAFQQSLGEHNMRSKGKMAFKFANQFVKTTVKNITWVVGNSGRITPLCWFEPVNLLGSRVEKASVYNSDYILTLGLDIGAEVLICKANEIIPRVEKVVKSTKSIAKTPTHCPVCNTKAQTDGKHLICPNEITCKARTSGRIKNWVAELNILEFGETLIDRLVETGKVSTVADLYKLSVADFASIDRMGQKSAQKCFDNLWANVSIPLEVFLGGLSIPGIGQSTIKAIMNNGCDTLEKFGKLGSAQFEMVSGVGPSKAQSLAQGLKTYQAVILEMMKLGVKVKDKIVGKLSGKSFAITGTLSMKRADIERMIVEAGGEVKSSCGKGCSYLVINDLQSTSSKATSAKKLGVSLIDEAKLMSMI